MRMKARNYGILNRSIARGISYGIRSYNWQKPTEQRYVNNNTGSPEENKQMLFGFLAVWIVAIFAIFFILMVGAVL